MKKIVFLTGTRADFGKLKSLISIADASGKYEVHIFATGMHMNPKYGRTVDEIKKCGFRNIFMFYNHYDNDSMDVILAKTIEGFSHFIADIKPDLIVIHGDRLEALAGAIVGGFNNILTAHVEGGEISGTIDESIRHSVSKLCHVHFVSNVQAEKRLLQLGEHKDSIFVIGSPDLDIMLSDNLPAINDVKAHYNIGFDDFAMMMFHPVTTEIEAIKRQAKNLVDAVLDSDKNYIVIYPNNDIGSDDILDEYERLKNNERFKIFPSLRFEYFLVLLQQSDFIIGNSSAGIREAPYYGIPTVNIGTRQQGRVISDEILNCGYESAEIKSAIAKAGTSVISKSTEFGEGNSNKLFYQVLESGQIWNINKQKRFIDLADF